MKIIKTETLAEVSWEIDSQRDHFVNGARPKSMKGSLRLQRLVGTSSKWLGDAYFFRFHDGDNEFPLTSNECYWSVAEFSSFKPQRNNIDAKDIIGDAVKSVIDKNGGNCALLAPLSEGSRKTNWIQLMESCINCYYPHEGDPSVRFPELIHHSVNAGLENFKSGQFMTISLSNLDQSDVTSWIQLYFVKVLNVDLDSNRIGFEMEQL